MSLDNFIAKLSDKLESIIQDELTHPAYKNLGDPSEFFIEKTEFEKIVFYSFVSPAKRSSSSSSKLLPKTDFLKEVINLIIYSEQKKINIKLKPKNVLSLASHILKLQPDEPYLKNTVTHLLTHYDPGPNDAALFNHLVQQKNKSYSKKIALHVLSSYDDKVQDNIEYSKDMLNSLSYFQFNCEDYPAIFKFIDFNCKKKSGSILFKEVLIDFLKCSISPPDWELFSPWLAHQIIKAENGKQILEEGNIHTFNLDISHGALCAQYPILKFEIDMKKMVKNLTYLFRKNLDNLGLQYIDDNFLKNTQITRLTFSSQHPIDKSRLMDITYSFIFSYHELFKKSLIQSIDEQLLSKTFDSIMIGSSLPLQEASLYKTKKI